MKQTYRIQQYMKDMTPYYESSKKNGNLTTESDSKDSDDSQSSGSNSDNARMSGRGGLNQVLGASRMA